MASPAPSTRRVLGDLSLNSPVKARVDSSRGNTDDLVKPVKMGERGSSLKPVYREQMVAKVADVGGVKRQLDSDSAVRGRCESPKRARVEEEEASVLEERSTVVRKGDAQNDNHPPSSPQTSPGSSPDSSQEVLDTSQHTILTEPDDAVIPAAAIPSNPAMPQDPRPLTRDQIRQKAKDGMLRLRLASYKVRTNQIHVPMAHLQIRSSPRPASASTSFAASYAASSNNRPQAQIIPASPRGPVIHLREPSSPKDDEHEHPARIPSSPPNQRNTPHEDNVVGAALASPPPREDTGADDKPNDGLVTPLLPRQRESLLDVPGRLGSQTPDTPGNELTSSVVKGRAADGLLSLMGGRKE